MDSKLSVVVVVLALAQGCTAIGFGVGAAVPRYETVPHATSGGAIETERPPAEDDGRRRKVGTYAGVGALAGLALDVTAVVLLVAAVETADPGGGGSSGGGGGGGFGFGQ